MSLEKVETEPGRYEFENVRVRGLQESDLSAIVRIDEKVAGKGRPEYFRKKIQSALKDTGIRVSLVAELENTVVGFVIGQVFYGEFGQPEPVAVVDSLGVLPAFQGQHVGRALMHQLKTNLRGLNIEKIQTQVDWSQFQLMEFFAHHGFSPAPRLCLECRISNHD